MRDQQPEPVSLGAAEKPSEEVLLNRYRVLARRGTGGFGTVCTCWDTRLQRRVAIKRIPVLDMDDGISASTAEEALGEARTACLLAHPNIVRVLDFEMEGAYAYLIMEYVDGLNLAELLSRVEGGTLSHDECAHMVASVGRALAFAHENGVLHLDIKPTNIMVDRRGTVKLADFGMATLASAAGYGDARGGTVGYMPPEQIQGMLVDERRRLLAGRGDLAGALRHGPLCGRPRRGRAHQDLPRPQGPARQARPHGRPHHPGRPHAGPGAPGLGAHRLR